MLHNMRTSMYFYISALIVQHLYYNIIFIYHFDISIVNNYINALIIFIIYIIYYVISYRNLNNCYYFRQLL